MLTINGRNKMHDEIEQAFLEFLDKLEDTSIPKEVYIDLCGDYGARLTDMADCAQDEMDNE
jgi:hypothetical protein